MERYPFIDPDNTAVWGWVKYFLTEKYCHVLMTMHGCFVAPCF